ncbi:hypothetical protein OH810_30735 (plasmid) [Streptomyces albidoflavus]|uniref:hypothetical protein n=1 Tax=Streptomyces albidoflavus TaxID=1886 RepID=UPI003C2DA0E0|nr:hypothetical protein OH810_30735 [Streptomyces albidoflavus]
MTPAPEPVLLDWRAADHFGRSAPCVLCGRPTPLRSHQGESVHKTCAETWNAEHPFEVRFVSDAPVRRRDNDAHA